MEQSTSDSSFENGVWPFCCSSHHKHHSEEAPFLRTEGMGWGGRPESCAFMFRVPEKCPHLSSVPSAPWLFSAPELGRTWPDSGLRSGGIPSVTCS